MPRVTQLGHRDMSAHGFSLFELVVAMVVVAALAGMAGPRFHHSLMRYRVDRAATKLVSDFALLRTEVRAMGDSRSMGFNVSTDQYGIAKMDSLDRRSEIYLIDLAEAPYHVDIVSVDFGGDTSVTFNAYGVPDSGGTVELQAGGFVKKIVLDADTARAYIE